MKLLTYSLTALLFGSLSAYAGGDHRTQEEQEAGMRGVSYQEMQEGKAKEQSSMNSQSDPTMGSDSIQEEQAFEDAGAVNGAVVPQEASDIYLIESYDLSGIQQEQASLDKHNFIFDVQSNSETYPLDNSLDEKGFPEYEDYELD